MLLLMHILLVSKEELPKLIIKYKSKAMAPSKIGNLFRLPFLFSYNTGMRRYITISKVHNFLGYNFYSRLTAIYTNLLEAFQRKDYRYLEVSFEQGLMLKFMSEMKHIEDGRFKFKMHTPNINKTLKKKKKLRDLLPIRQSVWNDGVTKIGVQCNVYFGQKFNREDPLFHQQPTNIKTYRVGQFRYVVYDPSLSIMKNISRMYQQQTYELLVKYSSKMYLSIQNYNDITTKSSNLKSDNLGDQEIITEIVMRTGNEKFDWVIVEINGINGKDTNPQANHNYNANSEGKEEGGKDQGEKDVGKDEGKGVGKGEGKGVGKGEGKGV